MSGKKVIQGLEEAVRHATRPNNSKPDGETLPAHDTTEAPFTPKRGDHLETYELPKPAPEYEILENIENDIKTPAPEYEILENIENDIKTILSIQKPVIDSLLLIIKALIGDTDTVEKLKNVAKHLENYQNQRMK
jgi:hypothetical protein